MDIKYYNRVNKRIEKELVYGGDLVDWLYQSQSGKILSHFLCKAPLSILYGKFQDLPLSSNKIPNFVKQYKINLEDYLPEEGGTRERPYSSFNSFFIRRFKENKRPFVPSLNEMGAFAEARYFGFETITNDQIFPIKGQHLKASGLVANEAWAKFFEEGPLLIARLCPVDYHRFHYPDNGKILAEYRVPGLYHSVNPVAIQSKQDIFITNERHVTILETENFGKLAYIEVGAICVGKIVQSKPLTNNSTFNKGEEKGYFLFGGSTVIVIGEKNKWRPSEDILKNTKEGIETYLHLGLSVATNGK